MTDGSLETPHLTLVPSAAEHLLALIEGPDQFERLAGLRVAPELRGFLVSDDVSPAWIAALREAHGPDPWRHGFFVQHREDGTVIGSAGFKGAPDSTGMVEIAYGVVPPYQGRGYATEAAAALVQFASRSGAVRLIRAHTRPEPNASTRVLEKCGFRRMAELVDPEDGLVWRWERSPAPLSL